MNLTIDLTDNEQVNLGLITLSAIHNAMQAPAVEATPAVEAPAVEAPAVEAPAAKITNQRVTAAKVRTVMEATDCDKSQAKKALQDAVGNPDIVAVATDSILATKPEAVEETPAAPEVEETPAAPEVEATPAAPEVEETPNVTKDDVIAAASHFMKTKGIDSLREILSSMDLAKVGDCPDELLSALYGTLT